MTLAWIIAGLVVLAAIALWSNWREQGRARAVRLYIIETAEIERRLALLNPRVARQIPLPRDEQAWLEKMLFEHRITSDRTKWADPNLGYDAISGTFGEFLATRLESGGSSDLFDIKLQEVRKQKMERLIADIGVPETQEKLDKWWTTHSVNGSPRTSVAPLSNERIYHAIAVRELPFQNFYGMP